MSVSDAEIISAMRSSPERGMRLLMSTYQERIYWHIRRLVVSHADAEDLLQEVFLKIYRSFAMFRGDSSLFSWVYRVATNMTITFLRNRNRQCTPLDSVGETAADGYFEFSDAEAMALQEAIHSLPPKQQTVFNLRYYDELSFKEIAEINSTTESAAKTNYHFAKAKIMEKMKAFA